MKYRTRKQKRTTKKWFYPLAVVLAAVVVVAVLELTNTTHIFHKAAAPLPTGPETKGETAASDKAAAGAAAGTSTNSQDKSSSSAGSASTTLITPTGNFVSDHHPNLSGSPAPNQMASDCTTTPGASCQISFTMDGVTKSLPSKTTDAQGSAYWESWTLQSIGLTQGTWTVKAIATLDGKNSTATDAQGLVVSP